MFLCESLYVVYVGPAALVGEVNLKWARLTPSPRVCWQLSPWYEARLEMEGMEPQPGVTRGFSYSPWPSLPSGGQGQIPRCWSCGPEGWRLADSTSCKCAFLPLTAVTPLPQKGTVLKWEGPQLVPDADWGAHWGGPTSQSYRQLPIHHLCKQQ